MKKILLAISIIMTMMLFGISFAIPNIDHFIYRVVFNIFSFYIFIPVFFVLMTKFTNLIDFDLNKNIAGIGLISGIFFIGSCFVSSQKINEESTSIGYNYFLVLHQEDVEFGKGDFVSNTSQTEIMPIFSSHKINKAPYGYKRIGNTHYSYKNKYFMFEQTAYLLGYDVFLDCGFNIKSTHDIKETFCAIKQLPYFWLESTLNFFTSIFRILLFLIFSASLILSAFIKEKKLNIS